MKPSSLGAKGLNDIGHDLIGSAFEVRNQVGRYFREDFYKHALAFEMREKGYTVEIEPWLPAIYKGEEIQKALRMDLLIEDSVVVELKAIPQVGNTEYRQLLTYLFLSKYKLGYLINFGAEKFSVADRKDVFNPSHGIYRFVNNI